MSFFALPSLTGTEPDQVAARRREQPRFVAVADQSNVWKISVPERLQALVRLGLKDAATWKDGAAETVPAASKSSDAP